MRGGAKRPDGSSLHIRTIKKTTSPAAGLVDFDLHFSGSGQDSPGLYTKLSFAREQRENGGGACSPPWQEPGRHTDDVPTIRPFFMLSTFQFAPRIIVLYFEPSVVRY